MRNFHLLTGLVAPVLAQRPSSCTDPSYGPVLSGIDFVDMLEEKREGVDIPEFGLPSITAQLNNYTFWFKSEANQKKFTADPWHYAPAYGAFWSYGIAYEGACQPGVDIWDSVFNKGEHHGMANQTFMERGQGPMNMFGSQLPGAKDTGDAAWVKCYGSDKSKWPFNTQCCAYNRQSTACPQGGPSPAPTPTPTPTPTPPTPTPPAPTPSPSPAPSSSCAAAIRATCGDAMHQACMQCCKEHRDTLIKSCPNGISDMQPVCTGGGLVV